MNTFDPKAAFDSACTVVADAYTGPDARDARTFEVKLRGKKGEEIRNLSWKAKVFTEEEAKKLALKEWKEYSDLEILSVRKLDSEERTDARMWEARIYEKAEHWSFDVNIKAKDEAEAYKLLGKDYPKKEYTIQSVRPS